MERPRALIIGAGGFLGTYLARAADAKFDVFRGVHSRTDDGEMHIDVSDAGSARLVFEATRPDIVVLLAAISDIDHCERQPDRAFAINVEGAEIIANLCAQAKTRLLFTSTAAVFDGLKHGYSEEDAPSPVNVYGRTKAQAEAAVQRLVPDALIVRFSLLIGFANKPGTNSMLDTLSAKWQAKVPVHLPVSEKRSPLHVQTLSELLVCLLTHREAKGIYHFGACDSLSRFELGKRLAALAGVPEDLVQPQSTPPSGRAPRGLDHFLLTGKIQKLSGAKSPTCENEMTRCFNGIA